MAAVIPLVVKVAVGAVVSKVVGKITGSSLLGALAGGFVGGGIGLDTASGAVSWTNALSGTTTDLVGGAAAGDVAGAVTPVVGGGAGMVDVTMGQQMLGEGGAAAGGSIAGGAAAGGSIAGGGAAGGSIAGGGIAGGGAAAGGQATQAAGGGMLSKAGNWLSQNPGLAKIGFQGISSAMQPDQLDLIEARQRGDEDLLRLKSELNRESKEPVDSENLKGLLKSYGTGVEEKGYRPQAAVLRNAQYSPMYMTRTSPNREKMLADLYSRNGG